MEKKKAPKIYYVITYTGGLPDKPLVGPGTFADCQAWIDEYQYQSDKKYHIIKEEDPDDLDQMTH